jgi:hypothetical protein
MRISNHTGVQNVVQVLPGDPASPNISRVSDTLITPHYWSRKCWNEGQRSTIKYTVRDFDFYLFLY